MSKGILYFGISNERINYLKLAYVSALLAKKHMPNIPITVVTDLNDTRNDFFKKYEDKILSVIDNLVVLDKPTFIKKNTRVYRDTNYYSITAEFKNGLRPDAYDLSPYDETLLIDVDYLMLNDSLKHVWGCQEDILINDSAINLEYKKLDGPEFRLNPYGIKMYWATVVYFKKCPRMKMFFEFIKHIKEHWDFYKLVYDFPSGLYRNDYAFSIAIHVLNGFLENKEIKKLPGGPILTLTDKDQLFKIKNCKEIMSFVNDSSENWKFYAHTIKGINLHCMNKISILNNFDEIIENLHV